MTSLFPPIPIDDKWDDKTIEILIEDKNQSTFGG